MDDDYNREEANVPSSSDQPHSSRKDEPPEYKTRKLSIGDFNTFCLNPPKPVIIKHQLPPCNQFSPKPNRGDPWPKKRSFLPGKRIRFLDLPEDDNKEKKQRVPQHNLSASLLESDIAAQEAAARAREQSVQSATSSSQRGISMGYDEIRASLSSSLHLVPPHKKKRTKHRRSSHNKVPKTDSCKNPKARHNDSDDDQEEIKINSPDAENTVQNGPQINGPNKNYLKSSMYCMNCKCLNRPQPKKELPVIKLKKDPMTLRGLTPARAGDILKSTVTKLRNAGIDVPEVEVRSQEVSFPSFGPVGTDVVNTPSTSAASPNFASSNAPFGQLPNASNFQSPSGFVPALPSLDTATQTWSNPLPMNFGVQSPPFVPNAQSTPPKPENISFNPPASSSLMTGPSTSLPSSTPGVFTFGVNNQNTLSAPAAVSQPATTTSINQQTASSINQPNPLSQVSLPSSGMPNNQPAQTATIVPQFSISVTSNNQGQLSSTKPSFSAPVTSSNQSMFSNLTPNNQAPFTVPTTSNNQAPFSVPTTSSNQALFSMPTTSNNQTPFSTPTTSNNQALFTVPTTSKNQAPFSAPTTSSNQAPFSMPTTSSNQIPFSIPTTSSNKIPFSIPTTSNNQTPFSLPTTSNNQTPFSSTAASSNPPSLFPSSTGGFNFQFGSNPAVTSSSGATFKFGSNPTSSTTSEMSKSSTPAPSPFPTFNAPSSNLNFASSSNKQSNPTPIFGNPSTFPGQKPSSSKNQLPSTAAPSQETKSIFGVPSSSGPASSGQQPLSFGSVPSSSPFLTSANPASANSAPSPFQLNANPLQFSSQPPKTGVVTNSTAPPPFGSSANTPKPGGFAFKLGNNPPSFGSIGSQPPIFTAPATPGKSSSDTNIFANNNPQPSTSAAVPTFGGATPFRSASLPSGLTATPFGSAPAKPSGMVFGSDPTTSQTPKPSFQFSSGNTNKANFVFGAPSTSQPTPFQFSQPTSGPSFNPPGPSSSTFQFSAAPQSAQPKKPQGTGFAIGSGGSTSSSRTSRDYRKRK